jgi:hypothetical protein
MKSRFKKCGFGIALDQCGARNGLPRRLGSCRNGTKSGATAFSRRSIVMQFSAAAAAALLLSAAAPAFAIDTDPCVGPKPYREVAQDEIRTIPELCGLHDQILRGNPDWQGDSADPIRKELEPPDPSAARRAALQPRHRY